MSQIALSLDQKEKALMAEAGVESKDFLKYMKVTWCPLTDKSLLRLGGFTERGKRWQLLNSSVIRGLEGFRKPSVFADREERCEAVDHGLCDGVGVYLSLGGPLDSYPQALRGLVQPELDEHDAAGPANYL